MVGIKVLAAGKCVRDQLRALGKRGVRIYLEDFGADGIALSRMASLPLDRVRLAPQFVGRSEQNPSDRAICLSALATAKPVGLRSGAAGVTTRGQLDYQIECGCEEATGSLFGTPKPLADEQEGSASLNPAYS